MINKKQYFRLTLVLLIPVITLSWWLSQQDFIIEQGKISTCNWKENTCMDVYSVPSYEVVSTNYAAIKYRSHEDNHLLLIIDFNAPIQAYYYDGNGYMIPTSRISSVTLDRYFCEIGSGIGNGFFITHSYYCTSKDAMNGMPQDLTTGNFKFIHENDEKKLNNFVSLAENQVDSYNHRYIWVTLILFIGIFGCYFILSYIIKFIIYGFNK